MDITGNQEQDLIIISQLYIYQAKILLHKYNKAKYASFLADYPNRYQLYKNELFLWLIVNLSEANNNLPEENQVEIIQYLIDSGADINYQNVWGDTALFLASMKGKKEIVKLLLDHGGYINHHDRNGFTPLIYASLSSDKDIVKLLLSDDGGADINAKDNDGHTVLFWASSPGKEDIVQLLLDSQEPEYFIEIQNLPPKIQDEIIRRLEKESQEKSTTPLALASEAANIGLVELLIQRHQ